MKILQVHNYYQQAGGEDAVVAAESAMLEAHGHEVVLFQHSNEEIAGWTTARKIFGVIWNRQSCAELKSQIESFQPDVVHFHNVFHAISLSAYQAVRRQGIPIVQTLHNYRLFCLNGLFFRQVQCRRRVRLRGHGNSQSKISSSPPQTGAYGAICELCLQHKIFPWPGVKYRCYRGSLAGSFVVATMLAIHRLLRTWVTPVSRFIALSSFCREKFIECGIPAEQIVIKPNFLSNDPGEGHSPREPQFLFLGRLSPEKGVETLLESWRLVEQNTQVADWIAREGRAAPRLLVAGTGSLAETVGQAALNHAKLCGHLNRSESVEILKSVRALVFPSVCYETFGLSVVEAMACGTPVLVSDVGAAASLVRNGETGLHFRSGDSEDLAEKIMWMVAHPEECAAMGRAARREFEEKYTAQANYEILMRIYRQVIAKKQMLEPDGNCV